LGYDAPANRAMGDWRRRSAEVRDTQPARRSRANLMPNKYKWLDTLGGPHLLIAEELLQQWRGSVGWHGGDRSDKSDYARACSIDTWLGEISSGLGAALVLAGDVGPIAWLPNPRNDGGFLVQWLGIDAEDDIESALTSREMADLLASENIEEIEFSTGSSGLMRLIDSVDPGRN
jgi:Immunity protein 21